MYKVGNNPLSYLANEWSNLHAVPNLTAPASGFPDRLKILYVFVSGI